jgi:replication factor C subunit 2/4
MATLQPWLEKYRPSTLADVTGNAEIVSRLAVIAEHGNMPHMILSGPPGVGKTTSVLCLAHALLGDACRSGVLELNASDDRGIDVIRTRVKHFAQKKVTLPANRHKIIILDEVDSMTPAAQQALRRIMELYSATTRFALACNTSSKVIEPIQSRCAILRFTRLSDDDVAGRVLHIAKAEGAVVTDDGLQALVFTAEGDMRQAINNLQSTHSVCRQVDADAVYRICDRPKPAVLEKMISSCLAGDLDAGLKLLAGMFSDGYCTEDLITSLFSVLTSQMPELGDPVRLELLKAVSLKQMRIVEGTNTMLQLSALLAEFYRVGSSTRPPAR